MLKLSSTFGLDDGDDDAGAVGAWAWRHWSSRASKLEA